MLKKIRKQSSKSSNFWNNIATITSALITGMLMLASSDPEMIKSAGIAQIVSVVLYNAANILYHSNKDLTN